ncbi:MAG TPA: hypothetical protein VII58_01645 [Acidobacteriaceae bacterium]
MAFDLEKWAEKVADAAPKGVQVERMWQEKLEAELKRRQAEEAATKPDVSGTNGDCRA